MARATVITAIFNAHCLYNADRQMRKREGEREIIHFPFGIQEMEYNTSDHCKP